MGCACGLALLICSCNSADIDNGHRLSEKLRLNQVQIDEVRSRVIAWYPIGVVDSPETRNVRRPIVKYGWKGSGFITGVLSQLNTNDRGIRRVLLHNPFGRRAPMQFDAYLEALQIKRLHKVTDTFAEDWWTNVTNPELGLGIEVIAYNGSPWLDTDSQAIISSKGEGAFYRFAWKAVEPIIQAGMEIGYDGAARAGKDSATYRFAKKLRNKGHRVYIEPAPPAQHSWWFDYPVLVRESTWQRRRRDPEFAPREALSGELVRIVRIDKAWLASSKPQDWPEAMCRIIAEGDSLAVSVVLLRQPQRKLEDLVACANDYVVRTKKDA